MHPAERRQPDLHGPSGPSCITSRMRARGFAGASDASSAADRALTCKDNDTICLVHLAISSGDNRCACAQKTVRLATMVTALAVGTFHPSITGLAARLIESNDRSLSRVPDWHELRVLTHSATARITFDDLQSPQALARAAPSFACRFLHPAWPLTHTLKHARRARHARRMCGLECMHAGRAWNAHGMNVRSSHVHRLRWPRLPCQSQSIGNFDTILFVEGPPEKKTGTSDFFRAARLQWAPQHDPGTGSSWRVRGRSSF